MSKKWYSIKYRFTALAKENREQNYKHYEYLKFLMKNRNLVNVSRKQKRLHNAAKKGEITSGSYPKDDKERRLPRQKDPSGELATTPPEQDGIKPMNEPELDQKNMDVDEAFFLSIMPNVKKLSDDEKLKFRVSVLNAVQSVTQKPKTEILPDAGTLKVKSDIISLD